MDDNDRVPYASVRPVQSLDLLSQREMTSLAAAGAEIHELFRRCALAVMNTGADVDDARELYDQYQDFEVKVVPESRGLKLQLYNCPAQAFVDGKMIEGIRAHLFSALRDIIFTYHKLVEQQHFDLDSPEGITDTVFRILRNAFIDRCRKSGTEIPMGETIDVAEDDDPGWTGDRRIVDVVTIRIAVAKLSLAHREVIALVDFVGYSYAEAANVLDIAEGTVMSRLCRARKALLTLIAEDNVTPLLQRTQGRRGLK